MFDFIRPLAALVLRGPALDGRVAGVRVVGVLAQGAGPGAEDEPPTGEEGAPQQRQTAAGAAETRLCCVPVLALVCHLALVYTCRRFVRLSVRLSQSAQAKCVCTGLKAVVCNRGTFTFREFSRRF